MAIRFRQMQLQDFARPGQKNFYLHKVLKSSFSEYEVVFVSKDNLKRRTFMFVKLRLIEMGDVKLRIGHGALE